MVVLDFGGTHLFSMRKQEHSSNLAIGFESPALRIIKKKLESWELVKLYWESDKMIY